ncbi:MAG: SHOCT domain-containing protein [Allosphingosinicella sp.]
MSSRYEELERLQRLRESGALSDEEFQIEKRRLLGHGESEAAARPLPHVAETDVVVEQEAPSRLPILLIAGGIALIVAIVAGLFLGRMVGGGGSDNAAVSNLAAPEDKFADANMIEVPQQVDVRTLPPPAQLAKAFEAAFGKPPPATIALPPGAEDGAETVAYTPGRLIEASYGPVLVSEGKVPDAAHVNAGRIAVHYLRPEGDHFAVVRAFPAAVAAGSFGSVGKWSVSPRFSGWPVIATQGGGMWQGYACSNLTLTELRPDGPVDLVTVPLTYDDTGAKTDGSGVAISGKLINIVQNQSFDVVYSGSRAFSEHYVRTATGYALAGGGKSGMETC